MATKGTYTAYRALKPLEGDISQDIQQQEENGFRRRALDQVDQRTQNDKADREAQRKQELWDKHVKPLSNYDTGSKSLNEAQGRLILEAQKEYVPLMSVINNPKSTDEEKLKATLKLQNINALPDNLANMTKSLTERDLAIKKGIADGVLFPDKAYDTNFQTGYQNKLLALDENGLPMIAFKNPDGTQDLETYDKIQNVVPKYDIQRRFDRDKELMTKGNKYKKGSDGLSLDEGGNDPTLDSYSTGNNYGSFRRIVRGTELSDLLTRAGYSNENELKSELKKMNTGKSSNASNKIKIDY